MANEPLRVLAVPAAPGDAALDDDLVAAASNADVAVITVDARDGLTPHARRSACVLPLLGVRHVVLAVRGLDLAADSSGALARIETGCRELVAQTGIAEIACLPDSAVGAHVEKLSARPRERIDRAQTAADVADQFEATLAWIGHAPLLPGRAYGMKTTAKTVTATVSPLKYKINFATLEHAAATHLDLAEVGVVQLELDEPVAFGPGGDLGRFTLLDPRTHAPVGAGAIRFALRRSHNVHWQAIDIGKNLRSAMKRQRPCVLWFTGISATGKSTIANLVEKKLHAMGRHTYLLDGDNVRHGLNKDLGFTEAARVENIRRVAEVARLMTDAGLIVLTAFISPFRNEREMARSLLPPGEFLEIFIDTPLAVAEERDPKGLYKKARRGELKNFTGIDSPYEAPESAEIRIDTTSMPAEAAAERIVEEMRRRGL